MVLKIALPHVASQRMSSLAVVILLASGQLALGRRAELLQDRDAPSEGAAGPGLQFPTVAILGTAALLTPEAPAAAEAPGLAVAGAPLGAIAAAPAPGPSAGLDATLPFHEAGAAGSPHAEPYLSFESPNASTLLLSGQSSTEQQRFNIEDSQGSQNFELATMDSNTWVEVNYTQLVVNAQRLLPQVKPGAIAMAMVKGGGYGHGVVTAARAFLEGGFTEIGTGTLNEALALRRSGVSAPVHLCYQPDIQSAPAVAHAPDVQVYVEDSAFLEALCNAATSQNKSRPISVHITVSTGALREGVRTEAEALSLGRQVVACPALHLRGLMTHHGNLTAFQPIIQAFRNAFGQDIIAHMASSSDGFFDGQQYHLDLVRLGTAMYGSERNTTAARWLTRITGIKQAYVGDKLGYQKESIKKDMTIALTDAGAVDGADIISEVVIRGKLCRVVGYGGMNMHMIDISAVPEARVGDLVMMSGCCADDGKYLQVWVPSIWPNVERIQIKGSEGLHAFEQEQKGTNSNSTTSSRQTYAEVHPPSD